MISTGVRADKQPTPSRKSAPSASSEESSNVTPDLSPLLVSLKLNNIELDDQYDIEIKPAPRRSHRNEVYASSRSEILSTDSHGRESPGSFLYRTRPIYDKKPESIWSEWRPFRIPYTPFGRVSPADGEIIQPQSDQPEKVFFEWADVPGASSYHLRIYDPIGNPIIDTQTDQSRAAILLLNNADYYWTVRPQFSEPEKDALAEQSIRFHFTLTDFTPDPSGKVDNEKKAIRYQYEIQRPISERRKKEPTVFESRSLNFRVRLGPGAYEFRSRPLRVGKSEIPWSATQRFSVPIPFSEQPASPKKTLEAVDDNRNPVRFTWKSRNGATQYRVLLYRKTGELANEEITTGTSLTMALPHQKSYRIHVAAMNSDDVTRDPVLLAVASQSFDIGTYKKLALAAAEEPSQLYGWARYQVSMIGFQAQNSDNNTKINKDLFGGTGELAIGYWHRKSNFGLVGIGALSGFTIGQKSFQYLSAGVLGGYRFVAGKNKRFRIWLGPTYREIPEILSSPSSKTYFKNVSTLGPELRVSFLKDISSKMGMQVGLNIYQGILDVKTPNGLKMKEAISYNLGFTGTYKYKNGVVGMAGYAYQVDSAKYATSDIEGRPNTLSYRGHYLSVSLLMGLQDKEK